MNPNRRIKFEAKRVTRSYVQTIYAEPSVVHSLICPVREAEWLAGWDHQLIFSNSGFAEHGCVFTTRSAAEETIWLITRRDDARCETEFARITPGSRAAHVTVRIADGGSRTSRVDICYTITALTEAGNRFIENFSEENFAKDMQFWEAAMNHYLKTGERLARADSEHWLNYQSPANVPQDES